MAGQIWARSIPSTVPLAPLLPQLENTAHKKASRLCRGATMLFTKTYKVLYSATSLSCSFNNLIRGNDF